MSARDLNEVDRRIAETRENIKRQRELVRTLRERGYDAHLLQAEGFLKVFEDSLTVLLERRTDGPELATSPARDIRARAVREGPPPIRWFFVMTGKTPTAKELHAALEGLRKKAQQLRDELEQTNAIAALKRVAPEQSGDAPAGSSGARQE
jgi:hypothetical protein